MGFLAALPFVGSAISGIIGAIGANSAANKQINFENQALQQTQRNIQPFVTAGGQSISQIMRDLGNGTLGPGSQPPLPAAFQAPTLTQAQNAPGYQFAQQQGTQGILEAAAAAGGNISGGTLKAADQYNQGLATTNYNNVFNQALQGYGANLQGYYGGLAGQQQGFNQLLAPAQIGAGAASSLNSNLSQIFANMGNASAAGTIGVSNAIGGGFANAANIYAQQQALQGIMGAGGGIGTGGVGGLGTQPNFGIGPSPIPVTTPPFVPGGITDTMGPSIPAQSASSALPWNIPG